MRASRRVRLRLGRRVRRSLLPVSVSKSVARGFLHLSSSNVLFLDLVTPQCQVTETPDAFIVTIALLVPVGTERLVVVTGFDQTGAAILRGMGTVDLTQPLQTVTVMLAPVQSNTPPRADAGPDQTVAVGTTVMLLGNGSSDADGDPLTFAWELLVRPPGSQATLSNPTSVNPTFVVDRPGAYMVQLTVNDGQVDSQPDVVTINTVNSRPGGQCGPRTRPLAVGDHSAPRWQRLQRCRWGSADLSLDVSHPSYRQSGHPLRSHRWSTPPLSRTVPAPMSRSSSSTTARSTACPATVTITRDNTPPGGQCGPGSASRSGAADRAARWQRLQRCRWGSADLSLGLDQPARRQSGHADQCHPGQSHLCGRCPRHLCGAAHRQRRHAR